MKKFTTETTVKGKTKTIFVYVDDETARMLRGLDEQSRLERIKTIEENLGPGDDIVEEEDISASEGDIIE